MTMSSPLRRVLGSGTARDGTTHWWLQRVTAAALVVLGIWFLVALTGMPGFDHAGVVYWVSRPLNSVLLLLFAGTLAWHSSLGVQVVIEDYVHGPGLKVFALILNRFAHIFVAVLMAFAIVRIALAGPA